MRGFRIKRLKEDLTSHSGLALVGRALARSGLSKEADRSVPLRHGIAHGDVLGACIGLLTLGKHDFGAVENQRKVRFFRRALGLRAVPSAPTLRQRFDGKAEEFLPLVEEASVNFLRGMGVAPGSLATGHVPLDCDVTPFDNSQTRKEGVSRTCHGTDGYAPMAAYPGREGYCVGFELRAGSQHCQKGTPAFLAQVLARARRLVGAPILVRLDAGNDAIENIATLRKHNETDEAGADHIIKWNPRRNSALDWFRHAGLQHPALDGADRPAGDQGRADPPWGGAAADSHRDAGAHVSGGAGDRVGPPPPTGVRAILRLGAHLRLSLPETRFPIAPAFAPVRPV